VAVGDGEPDNLQDMRHLLEALHILFAIFAIGPLVHAATTAARGVKAGDASAVAGSARTVKIYGYASIAVAVLGFGLVQPKWDNRFGDTWVWLSLVLYLVSLAVVFALLLPSLQGAAKALTGSTVSTGGAVDAGASAATGGSAAEAFTARIAAGGGLVALIFAVIVFLMVFKPGS
jgi:uncharacterized membrane protein